MDTTTTRKTNGARRQDAHPPEQPAAEPAPPHTEGPSSAPPGFALGVASLMLVASEARYWQALGAFAGDYANSEVLARHAAAEGLDAEFAAAVRDEPDGRRVVEALMVAIAPWAARQDDLGEAVRELLDLDALPGHVVDLEREHHRRRRERGLPSIFGEGEVTPVRHVFEAAVILMIDVREGDDDASLHTPRHLQVGSLVSWVALAVPRSDLASFGVRFLGALEAPSKTSAWSRAARLHAGALATDAHDGFDDLDSLPRVMNRSALAEGFDVQVAELLGHLPPLEAGRALLEALAGIEPPTASHPLLEALRHGCQILAGLPQAWSASIAHRVVDEELQSFGPIEGAAISLHNLADDTYADGGDEANLRHNPARVARMARDVVGALAEALDPDERRGVLLQLLAGVRVAARRAS